MYAFGTHERHPAVDHGRRPPPLVRAIRRCRQRPFSLAIEHLAVRGRRVRAGSGPAGGAGGIRCRGRGTRRANASARYTGGRSCGGSVSCVGSGPKGLARRCGTDRNTRSERPGRRSRRGIRRRVAASNSDPLEDEIHGLLPRLLGVRVLEFIEPLGFVCGKTTVDAYCDRPDAGFLISTGSRNPPRRGHWPALLPQTSLAAATSRSRCPFHRP